MNGRNNLIYNLWRFCLKQLDPNIVAYDDQMVSFTLPLNNSTFGIIVVYVQPVMSKEECYGAVCSKFNTNKQPPNVLLGISIVL